MYESHDVKLTDRMAEDGIRIANAELIGFTDNGQATWKVTFKNRHRRQFTPTFYNSIASGAEYPITQEVFWCCLSDAAAFESTDGFYDFASAYGYDLSISEDTRKAKQAYNGCKQASAKLRRFLGEAYDAYMYETEFDV